MLWVKLRKGVLASLAVFFREPEGSRFHRFRVGANPTR